MFEFRLVDARHSRSLLRPCLSSLESVSWRSLMVAPGGYRAAQQQNKVLHEYA